MRGKIKITLKIMGILLLIFIGGIIFIEIIGYVFFNNRNDNKEELMILCEKDDVEPIILIHSNQNNSCLSCPDDLKERLDTIEIDYNNLRDNRQEIVESLEFDGWNCK